MATKKTKPKKVFVLDTNVLIQDPMAFMRMGEHDVVIPLVVITEVDKVKNKGNSVSPMARQVSANLDVHFGPELYKTGVPLGEGKGNLSIFIVRELHSEVRKIFKEDSPDNRIISAALLLKEKVSREENKKKNQKKKVNSVSVVFVSNDINLRFKAAALGLTVEKYRHDAIDDASSLYPGVEQVKLSDETVSSLYQREGLKYSIIEEMFGADAPVPYPNEFFIIEGKAGERHLAYYSDDALYAVDSGCKKIYNTVTTRNDEQQLAMHALLDPNVSLVTLSGPAGTGKTLLAIGSAIQQSDKFDQILISKPIVALSEKDNGFLPGDMIEKVMPYMQSLNDNINFLKATHKDVGRSKVDTLLDTKKILIEPLAYIRGRTYANTILIIDEAQNLNPLEVKTIVTRMGENSKVIFTGDIYQIDDRFLDSTNNGLTYLIERSKDCDFSAHINLVKGERSALAEWGGQNL